MDGIHRMERRRREVLSLVEEILHTATQLKILRNAQMRDAGLDRQRWAVLLAIARSDYCLSISDLARTLRQSRQATQRMTLALAREGWIEHRPNNDDRRLLQLFLTSRGKKCHRYDAPQIRLIGTGIHGAPRLPEHSRGDRAVAQHAHAYDRVSPGRQEDSPRP